jgi:hypothetical protein
MKSRKRVGIIGYSGTIGRKVIDYLKNDYKIRGGSRHLNESELDIELMKVDTEDEKSLEQFCDGCDLVINCAGPSFLIGDKIVKCAANKGVSYIDAFGANLLENKINESKYKNDIVTVISAGVFPGFSAMLVKWLANKFDKVENLVAYFGGQERCSWSATMDLLLSTKYNFGVANAEYCNGEIVKNASINGDSTELPGVPQKVYLQKFLSSESIRIANELKIGKLEWYSIISDKLIYDNLTEAYSKIVYEEDIDKISDIADNLANISSMFANGGDNWYRIVIDVLGECNGITNTKRLVIENEDSSKISAIVISKVAKNLLEKNHNLGVYWADEILNQDDVTEILDDKSIINSYQFVDVLSSSKEIDCYEEGVL